MFLDLIRKTALYAPEGAEGAGATTEATPPAEGTTPAAGEPATGAETAPAEGEGERPAQTPWFMKRIEGLTGTVNQKDQENAALKKRLADAEALADRLQREKNPEQRQETRAEARNDNNRQAEINAAAAQQRLMEDSAEIRNRGIKEFGAEFEQSVRMLQALNAVTDEFVADVIGAGKDTAHAMIYRLGRDPDKVETLVAMNPRQRIAELARMTIAMENQPEGGKTAATTPAGTKTSRAPAPPPAIASNNKTTKDWRTADSDKEFSDGYDAYMKARIKQR
jgi:hypothetical protein